MFGHVGDMLSVCRSRFGSSESFAPVLHIDPSGIGMRPSISYGRPSAHLPGDLVSLGIWVVLSCRFMYVCFARGRVLAWPSVVEGTVQFDSLEGMACLVAPCCLLGPANLKVPQAVQRICVTKSFVRVLQVDSS